MSVGAARGDVQRDRWVPRSARIALGVVVVVGACGFALAAMRRETGVILGALAASAILAVFSVLGIVIAGRKHNTVGLIFSALAVAAVIQLTADDYILRANVTAPGSLPRPEGGRAHAPPCTHPHPPGALQSRPNPARSLEATGPRDQPEAEGRRRQGPERPGQPGRRPALRTRSLGGAPREGPLLVSPMRSLYRPGRAVDEGVGA